MSTRPELFRSETRIDRLRVPPQSVEAEQSVLGGLIISPAAFFIVDELLTEQDFYRRDHRLIFRAIQELHGKNQPFDVVTLGEWLEANNLAEQIGETGYLIDLSSNTPSAANIRAYAEIVREKSILRQLIEAGTDIVNQSFLPNGRTAMEVLSAGQARLGSVLKSDSAELESTTDILRRMINQQVRRQELDGDLDGLSTGLPELDHELCGLKPGQLIIIAARPKMGKTTLAANIAEHNAIQAGKRVAVHSLEMPPEQLLERSCCSIGRVPHDAVRRAAMTNEQSSRFYDASALLANAAIRTSKPRNVRVQQLIAQTMRAHADKPFDLVVFDYLQLIDCSGSERRDIGIGEITRQLKLMAETMGVPVILISQLNRKLEERTDKRPMMSDLRDGGGIEQDADVILFVYRDEIYHSDTKYRGTAEIIIGAQRAGPTGMVRVETRLDICRFDPLPDDYHPIQEQKKPEKDTFRNKPDHKKHASGQKE